MSEEVDMDGVSIIISSRHRLVATRELLDGVRTPTMVADATDLSVPNASRAISDLRDAGVVELKVSEDTKRGRIYGIADEAVAERAVEIAREG